MNRNSKPLKHSQHGAALVVALILILISTLLGVTAMQSSGIEGQLATNDRFREASFRAAEGTSESLLTAANIKSLANTATSASGAVPCLNSTTSPDTNITVAASLCNSGSGNARGYSLGENRPSFHMLKFTSRAVGSVTAVDTRREILQGSERLAPKPDTGSAAATPSTTPSPPSTTPSPPSTTPSPPSTTSSPPGTTP